MRLQNRVALITGGGRGIGRGIALAFAREGADVAVVARTTAEIEAVAEAIRKLGRRAVAIPCDVTDPEAVGGCVQKAEAELGAIQILVNNAGIAVSARLVETDDALWHRHLAVNLTGAFYMTRAVLPGMLARKWGRIINVASTAAKHGSAYTTAYTASKHGLLGLTRALALEVVGANITVNALCPGYVATDLTWEAARRIAEKTGRSYEEAVRTLASFSPQKRLIEPDEVAEAAVLLASEAGAGITGQGINIDGGAVQS